MTDQNQFQDPQTQGAKQDDQNQDQSTGIFGGSDDIFENSDILEPIIDITKDNSPNTAQEVVPEMVENIPEVKSEEPKIEGESSKSISNLPDEHEGEKMDDFFDPFDDTLEEVEDDGVPNFEASPEIDALDDLDNLDVDVETMDTDEKSSVEEIKPVKVEVEEAKPETKDINETIARIEKKAQEVREKAKKLEEETSKVEVKPEIKEEKKEIAKEVIKEKKKEDVIPVKTKTEIVEEKKIEIKETKTEEKPKIKEVKIEKTETTSMKTDLQNKFDELLLETKKVYELLGEKDTVEGFDIVGGNDDRLRTTYNLVLSGENLEINKIELTKSDNSVQEYKLEFVVDKASLNVKVDGELLYDEIMDLQENENKKMQVMEKLNKFIFLVSEELKKLEKEKGKKEKKNILKGIFRNFMF